MPLLGHRAPVSEPQVGSVGGAVPTACPPVTIDRGGGGGVDADDPSSAALAAGDHHDPRHEVDVGHL